MMLKRVLPAMLMALLIGGCGGGGGGGGDDDSAADSGETTTETADTGSDTGTVTPSTTDDTTSSEESTDPEELFATRYVSSEDYHAWYCEFDEGEFEDYVFALILVESGGGAFSLANKVTGESVDSFAGVWEATEQDLTLINEEEQLGVEVYDYTFYTATIWDGAMSVYDDSSQDPTFLCALGDQDGNAVEQ